jgi:hypothetical protein
VPVALTFGVLLWAHPGLADDLAAYEDAVLALLAEHGGRVEIRVRSDQPDAPTETQVITFADDEGYAGYLADPRRTDRAAERDRVVACSQLFRGELRTR